MKRAICIVAAAALIGACCTAFASAELLAADLFLDDAFSRYSVEELFELYDRIVDEISLRQYTESGRYTFAVNKKSKKFHSLGCKSVRQILPENRLIISGDRDDLIDMLYEPCGDCNP